MTSQRRHAHVGIARNVPMTYRAIERVVRWNSGTVLAMTVRRRGHLPYSLLVLYTEVKRIMTCARMRSLRDLRKVSVNERDALCRPSDHTSSAGQVPGVLATAKCLHEDDGVKMASHDASKKLACWMFSMAVSSVATFPYFPWISVWIPML